MPDTDGYPTESELNKVQNWDLNKDGDAINFVKYIQSIWHWPEYTQFDGKNLELHTGGWSGNEEIIQALEKQFWFWMFYWQKSTRGGHYWFEIPKG